MSAAPPRLFSFRQLLTSLLPVLTLAFTLDLFLVANCSAATPGDDHRVTMNMRDGDIRALIQWIAEQTHKQIVIDPRVQGRVSVFADQPVTISQAYQIFLATLQTQGYATSETEGVLKIFPVPMAKGGPRELIETRAELVASGQVMHVINLQNVLAAELGDLIKPLLSPTGYVAPLAGTNALLIADDSNAVSQLADLARRLDSDGNLDVDVVKLHYANARDIAQVLTPLTRGGSTGGTQSAASSLSIGADERSNTILLAGDPANRSRARQLVQQLDQPISTAGFTRVVFLNYLSADELVPVLKSIVGAQQKDAKDQSQQGSISIEASKSTNALVLTGPGELLDAMQETIAKLDVRRSQVLVQAVIVEVSQDLTNSLGVEWSTDFNSDGVQAASSFGLAPAAVAAAASGNPLTSLNAGLTLGYMKNGSLRAIIHALGTTSDANLLSTPSVMTLDNQEAEILVGSNIPVVTGQYTTDGTNTSNPFTTIERKDIGVTLKLTPQINRDNAVTLEILQEVETLASDVTTGAKDLVTNKRSINTKVIVNDNDVLVLGGLISDEDQKQEQKVPVLGDMPLVGSLFRSTSTQKVKRNLMVFIHPTVIDGDAKGETLSRTRYEELRNAQPAPSTTTENKKMKTLPEFETFKPQTKTDTNKNPETSQ